MSSVASTSTTGELNIAPPRRFHLLRLVRRVLGKKYKGYLLGISKQSGYCYSAEVPEFVISDKYGVSRLVAFEDAVPLKHPHAIHSEIESLGAGRYSHWERWILFSSSDNSDPNTNGRIYTVREI